MSIKSWWRKVTGKPTQHERYAASVEVKDSIRRRNDDELEAIQRLASLGTERGEALAMEMVRGRERKAGGSPFRQVTPTRRTGSRPQTRRSSDHSYNPGDSLGSGLIGGYDSGNSYGGFDSGPSCSPSYDSGGSGSSDSGSSSCDSGSF